MRKTWPHQLSHPRKNWLGTEPCICCGGPKAWNQLPMHIRVWETVSTFKMAPKTHFHSVDYVQIVQAHRALVMTIMLLGTCEASWFDSIWNRTSDLRFDSYWWSDSKFSNRPRYQSSFVKKQLVVVKFAFKVYFGSKISVQQHCLMRFMTELK